MSETLIVALIIVGALLYAGNHFRKVRKGGGCGCGSSCGCDGNSSCSEHGAASKTGCCK